MSEGPHRSIPTIIGGGRVLFYSRIDERHRSRRPGQDGPYGLAICERKDSPGVFLFTCEDDWMPVVDSWHATVEEAKQQAAFEWDGIDATWDEPPPEPFPVNLPDTVDPLGPKGK